MCVCCGVYVYVCVCVCVCEVIYHTALQRFRSTLLTDKRVKVMNEVISGMRVIKMYAWEHAFSGVVNRLRR